MRSLRQLAVICLLSGGAAAYAQTPSEPWLLRGFGTLGATRTDDSGTGYLSYPQNISRASRNKWSIHNDSLLGVQLDVNPDQQLSATAQVIARYRAHDRIEPLLEWGFVKYRHDDHWTVQAGRLLTPVQMDSENRFVGYANTTVRTDLSAYSLYPLSNHDGVNLTHERMLGDTHLEVLGYAGRASIELPGDAEGDTVFRYKAHWIKGLRLSLEHDRLAFRMSYTTFDDYVDGPPTDFFKLMLGQARMAQANGCSSCRLVAQALQNTLTDIGSTLLDVGVRYDFKPYAIWGEYFTNSARESLRSSYQGVALGASVRQGQWTPYVTYGLQKLKKVKAHRISDADLPNVSPLLRAFNKEPLFPSNSGRQTWAIGTRYEIARNAALKAEMLQVRLDDPARAYPTSFPKLSPATEPRTKSFGLYTLALDFIF
ncbi:hypothetical protein [Aquabacterium sp.]|uniref:hypothetical protein n=1 Tax=Aquabacterium sp. TaxID=1872578 RepID=UPI002E31B86C|nr:hypothetical protein [Aquabacterium sp.]HEX5310762.1 hypothetical protein [Aquabacterium sp.]